MVVGRPPRETDERESVRRGFDDDADAYDRSRPIAPAPLYDDLLELAGLDEGSAVLEIGPGTGQATRELAARGLHVLALELGPNLAVRARANLAAYDGVEVVNTAFEDWDPGDRTFDAVFACNSFHWLHPERRFPMTAALLRDGGHLTVVATPWVIPDDADRFWWDVQDDYEAVGGERIDPADAHPDRVKDLGPLVRACGLFEEPVVRRYPFSVEFTAEQYALNLSTQSGIKTFPGPARSELIERIRDRVERRGGAVIAHLLGLLTVAKLKR